MLEPHVVRALLAKAVAAIGIDKVGERLNATPESVRAWMNGHASMPERKTEALLDLMGELPE